MNPSAWTLMSDVILQEAYVPQALRQNVRVTLQMGAQPNEFTLQQLRLRSGQQVLFGQLAESASPREQQGTYWGYTTRLASTLSQVFADSPFEVHTHNCCACITNAQASSTAQNCMNLQL